MRTEPGHREGLCEIDGIACYRVPDVDRLPPFLLTVVSPSEHWLYVSSNGGLTAGRVNNDRCLFPYRTDDLLHQVHAFSGPWTGIRVGDMLWEPFTSRLTPGSRRDLARSVSGDRIVFEETNPTMGLTVRAWWAFSDASGFVRTVHLERDSTGPRELEVGVIDGLRELVAGGAGTGVMQSMSCLVNAYTRAELVDDSTLATVAMESALVDRAEPAESLRATTVWSTGIPEATLSLDPDAIHAFTRGQDVEPKGLLRGRAAAYLLTAPLVLEAGERMTWSIVADVHRSQAQVADLRRRLAGDEDLADSLAREVAESTRALDAILVDTDGIQRTGDPILDAHHRTNTLFNDMRGGVFTDGLNLPWGDWVDFCRDRNADVAMRHRDWLEGRDADSTVDRRTLVAEAAAFEDPSLERIAWEYLPVWFGRRHGDPSRPWNAFNIRVKHHDGSRRLTYEGNWRDIFQNWESLTFSNPGWIDHVIAKFVNASTADGFNPYRITREGIDWEAPEPGNPWSNIGYWGDHQIGYLTRLLELSTSLDPGHLPTWLDRPIFSHADVPYRLADHRDLVADPRNTITFDHAADDAATERTSRIGADGKLVHDDAGVVHVTLAEKLVIPVLAKISSFVPDGGVWMNTQRPEWNDANNALAGYGLSMVTASYLRRHLALLAGLYRRHEGDLAVTDRVLEWLREVNAVLVANEGLLDAASIDDRERRTLVDKLGLSFERYRHRLDAPSKPVTSSGAEFAAACEVALRWIDHAIASNRRTDGLYHGYNLVSFGDRTATVHRLPEMLEGQVAVLSAGVLDPGESATLLETIFTSSLHREDHDTFLLYPVREIPPLLDKGVLDADSIAGNPLLAALLASGDRRLVERDDGGTVRFASDLRNRRDLERVLGSIAGEGIHAGAVSTHGDATIELYERVFDHHRFTGRSGGMYGYEGIGCTYWHMVAKLLVAAGECVQHAEDVEAATDVRNRLRDAYHRVRDGLGFRRSAVDFGALPIDAYSHTPGGRGAQQPGMTGQVKEELITRRMELGIRLEDGGIRFNPTLLPPDEWLLAEDEWAIPAGDRAPARTIRIPSDGLGFQLCGIPVVYRHTDGPGRITIVDRDGTTTTIEGDLVIASIARPILDRNAMIDRIEIELVR